MLFEDPTTGRPHRAAATQKSPCGELAYIEDAGYPAYKCSSCNAIIGSVSMPIQCHDLMNNKED